MVALNSTKAPFLGAILLCVPRRPRARAEGTIPYSSGAVESKPWCPMICDCGRIRCPGTYRAASSPALIRQTLSGGILLSPFRNLFYSAGLNSAGIRLTVIRKSAYSRKCAPKSPLGVSANIYGPLHTTICVMPKFFRKPRFRELLAIATFELGCGDYSWGYVPPHRYSIRPWRQEKK